MIDDADKAFVHPMGMKVLCDAIPSVEVTHDHSEHSTFHGLPIFQDPNMPDDEIHFRDRAGNLVGKITGIGK